jgi:hypothetical protein
LNGLELFHHTGIASDRRLNNVIGVVEIGDIGINGGLASLGPLPPHVFGTEGGGGASGHSPQQKLATFNLVHNRYPRGAI